MSDFMPPEMPPGFEYPYKKLVSFLTDYGFKVTFGEDSLFSRKAVSVLLGESEPLQKLTVIRNELTAVVKEGRAGLYDVIYHDQKRRVIILEMQGSPYEFIEERLQFYGFMQFTSLVKKGKKRNGFKDLPPVICICIIKDRIFSNRRWHNHFKLQNRQGEQLGRPMEFHTFELGKFPFRKNQAARLSTDIQKLLFTMKYAEQLVEEGQTPAFFKEEWLAEPLGKLAMSQLSAVQRTALDIDYYNNIYRENRERWAAEREIEEAKEASLKEGMEKGMEKAITEVILACHEDGFPLKTIAKISHLTIQQVEDILQKHGKLA